MRDDARDPWQRPLAVIDALALSREETVVDVGAGAGYFARHLAALARRVIAVEPERTWWPQLTRFEVVGSLLEVRGPVDLVFAANVLRFLGAEERARVRAIASRLVLIDWKPGPRPVGPPAEDAVPMEEAVCAFPDFVAGPAHDFLPHQWMIELRR